MTIHIDQLIELLAEFCDDKNLKATGIGCVKGGLITGASAVIGGLLLGPVGLAIGGAVGGIGAATSLRTFQPVAVIFRNLPQEKKRKLANRFVNVFRDLGVEDAAALAMLLSSSSSFQSLIIRQITSYLNDEMQMRIAA